MFSSKSVSGAPSSRDELLGRARLEREARQAEKRKQTAALTIQVATVH